ncbi:MAG: V-type ATP synthase subunit A [Patescibacteria group bacterium]
MLKIINISGPLITASIEEGKGEFPQLLETVYVGNIQLLGEVIAIKDNECKIQVYEDTSGLQVGEPVELRGELLSVELGPGLLGNIFDGIQRPLKDLEEVSPLFINSGIHLPRLSRSQVWKFEATANIGDEVAAGSKLGFIQETDLLKHWILVPQNVSGVIDHIGSGSFGIEHVVAKVRDTEGNIHEVKMYQKCPVKIARKIKSKLSPKKIFTTGQRVIDAVFPIMLGAPVSTPGPFGAGKTFTQQQLAKWSNAQIVVYVGCGERGNEMTEMVKLFPTLNDPKTGKPLMQRTVLVANTSNMPIAAREASIYTGVTIAEYFRDMGYDVVVMADSTSRWAEAMREISARLGEMPADEGYPAYLSSRIAAFYERAGIVETLAGEEGSVTVVGTVSPPGGDFSDPVTQASLKNTQVYLALDAGLAARRHYPSINWQTSYSLYEDKFSEILSETEAGEKFIKNRKTAKLVLNKEGDLLELVKLVGVDGLSNEDRLVLEISKSLREDFLQQNGFDPVDTYCSFDKTEAMLNLIVDLYNELNYYIKINPENDELVQNFFDGEVKTYLSQMKYCESVDKINELLVKLVDKLKNQNAS